MSGAPPSFILTYHSLDMSGSSISVAPELFRRHMDLLARVPERVVPLADIQKCPGTIAITFDDGFRNFHEYAFPILRAYGLPATVFVVSGYCGGRNDWPTQVSGVPVLELMGWDALAEIAEQGIALGAHTVSHPLLTAIGEEQIEAELENCRLAIERRTGRRVETFAYPYGAANGKVRNAVGRHFQIACGTHLDVLAPESNPLELPRLDCYYLQRSFWFERLTSPLGRSYILARRGLRAFRQLLAG